MSRVRSRVETPTGALRAWVTYALIGFAFGALVVFNVAYTRSVDVANRRDQATSNAKIQANQERIDGQGRQLREGLCGVFGRLTLTDAPLPAEANARRRALEFRASIRDLQNQWRCPTVVPKP